VVSGLQLGWFAASETEQVGLILIAFVFPLQLLTSVFGYLARDAVAGTGMGILAGTWLAIGLVALSADRHRGLGGHSGDPQAGVVRARPVRGAGDVARGRAMADVLPLGRRGVGRESLSGNLEGQIARIEREAGVREQL
jgi:hypothetical protein